MAREIQYAVIPADVAQPIRFVEGKPDLATWQEAVGGYIESVTVHPGGAKDFPIRDGVRLFINEEGKLNGLPFNRRATLLAYAGKGIRGNDVLVGDVAVYGGVDGDGECTGLKQPQMDLLLQLATHFAE